jgi:ABC-type transport system substrate-binding protein
MPATCPSWVAIVVWNSPKGESPIQVGIPETLIGTTSRSRSRASRAPVNPEKSSTWELPEIEELYARLGKTADAKERATVIRGIGDILYSGFHTIPLVDLYALFGVNQKKVGEWKTTGYYGFTHLEYVQKR